jgi:hypothetical protein
MTMIDAALSSQDRHDQHDAEVGVRLSVVSVAGVAPLTYVEPGSRPHHEA